MSLNMQTTANVVQIEPENQNESTTILLLRKIAQNLINAGATPSMASVIDLLAGLDNQLSTVNGNLGGIDAVLSQIWTLMNQDGRKIRVVEITGANLTALNSAINTYMQTNGANWIYRDLKYMSTTSAVLVYQLY